MRSNISRIGLEYLPFPGYREQYEAWVQTDSRRLQHFNNRTYPLFFTLCVFKVVARFLSGLRSLVSRLLTPCCNDERQNEDEELYQRLSEEYKRVTGFARADVSPA